MRFPFFFIILCSVLFSSCNQKEEAGQIVARVDDQVLTLAMVQAQIDPSRNLTDAELRQFVNHWVTNELLFQEAHQRGYDNSEDIQRKVSDARKQFSIASLLEKEVYSLAENSVQPNDITAYFQTRKDDFILKEDMVWLSMAVFNQTTPANQFRASSLGPKGWHTSVDEFQSEIKNGFLSFSDSLFFTSSSLYPPELWKVATALGKFEVSFPVKTSVGYIVIRSLGTFKKNTPTPVKYVEGEIRRRLAMERRQERYQNFIQQLRTRHTVQFMISTTDSVTRGGE
ncbi:MAG: peptidylprolyl isomerase [Bacteroidota bacterium]|nr:peptidylprolyl isomerase [Bacteroidota bacterium]